jgi:hypothetical protein
MKRLFGTVTDTEARLSALENQVNILAQIAKNQHETNKATGKIVEIVSKTLRILVGKNQKSEE